MDLNNMQTWQYGAIIGGSLLIIGLIVYFLPAGKFKIPGGVTAGFGGLALGLAAGIIWMAGFGYQPHPPGNGTADDSQPETKGTPKSGPIGFGKGGGNQKGGAQKGGGFGGGGGRAPNPRLQLVGLVSALDSVADHPVVVNLTPENRAAIAEQLKGLDAAAEIKDEDAKAKLDAIQKIVEKDRKTLEAVGYRWVMPDGKSAQPPKGGFPKDSPNPFAEGQPKGHLKSLQGRLEKK